MKGIFKANTVYKYLSPIRNQIIELIEANTTLVEFGCGNGDLLFKLSDKIQSGIGLDKSEQLISYALKRKKKEKVKNLEFRTIDLVKESFSESKKDYSIASLLFHIVTWQEATELLRKLIASSETTIVCGFSKPKNLKQYLLLWLDQRFTSHYSNYRNFKKEGFTEGLLNSLGNIKYSRFDTFDPVMKIYKITEHNNV
ncbi:methyltransferase domain-containing protein [Arenibacter sp. N53]|uniref:class I SAM-dependent methyltransferase n=1 Tax=Arenibacter TaxID=178469 RepID=UPI000CD3DDEC|nr:MULTISPECIES: class I SAM-dependent methyltransferase [Arenibacter]MCM4153951.1 methyltransferase domain-containing protein [Arenibacter sp. N53]